jgi:cytochrome c55X
MMPRWLLIVSALLITTPSAADIAAARQQELLYLLKQDCGSCHGMTLKGGLGPSLLPGALEGKPTELLVMTVLEGRAGTAMPPWKAMLSETEAAWLVTQMQRGVN